MVAKKKIQSNEKQWEKFVVTSLALPASLELEKGNHKSASDRRKRLKRREVEWEKEDETGITTTAKRDSRQQKGIAERREEQR